MKRKRVICIAFFATIGILTLRGKEKTIKEKKHGGCKNEVHIPYGLYEKYFKRLFDVIIAGTGLIVLGPVIGVTAFLVRVKMGTPILFAQKRPGLNGKIFTLYKFRTMTAQKDQDGNLLPDEKRITRFGEILRSASLDELPELLNIIRGDMSIVGPRPLLTAYLSRYNENQYHRHDVRPGLTGLAQINGRNQLSWEEKFEYDLQYVNKITFIGDIRIIFNTITVVFKGTGISSQTSVTMDEFKGNGK